MSFFARERRHSCLCAPKAGRGHNTQWENHMDAEISADIVAFLNALSSDSLLARQRAAAGKHAGAMPAG